MATLELRKTSKWWYGRWTENGHVVVQNLDVKIAGSRPARLSEIGDRRFEQTRAAAEAKVQQLARDAQTRKHVEGLAQAIHVARTGNRIGTVPIDGIFNAWQALSRRRGQMSVTYGKTSGAVFRQFVEFLEGHYPDTHEMADVTHEMAAAFLASERARGVSGRTFNAALSLLKSAFRNLRRQASIVDNPFDGIVGQDENTMHRIPFMPDELRAILDAAKDDSFCRPLIVTGICTAMRRGDVCQLRWADVDMENRFITVLTSKTGARVSIPMFQLLHDELTTLPRTSKFCFPDQAALYQAHPDAITVRLARVFAAAGFVDAKDDQEAGDTGGSKQQKKAKAVAVAIPEAEMLQRGRDQILAGNRYTAKVRTNMLKIFERYMAGGTLGSIMKEFGLSKGGASMYFKRIEEVVGFAVVRQRRPKPTVKIRAAAHATRQGLKKVNQRGFHAFRASWVTLAMTAGVPVDLVRKVTGHTTVETVLTHYFQPGKEDFRKALEAAMPKLLTSGGTLTRDEQVRELLDKSTTETWQQDRDALLALMAKPG